MLECYSADPKIGNIYENNPLMNYVLKNKNVTIEGIEYFLKLGIDLNQCDKDNQTLLHYAV